MSLFPIFLKLTGRSCIVIGAGHLAESKIASLRSADARVTVIAPEANAGISDLAANGEVSLLQRPYKTGDLDNAFLVVAATNDPAVNRVVRRGDLQVAISTAGNSPALAQQLRKELNEQLPLDLGEWLADLGNLRREVVATEPLNESRRLILHELAQRQVCSYDQCPSRLLAREHARTNPQLKEKA
jgi:precorrin-2 dehydrogenase/sirohydrochlorin ferrochelatase